MDSPGRMIGTFVITGCEHILSTRSRQLGFSAGLLVLAASAALAQATPTVPPDDPVYAFVDRLIAARLIDTVVAGQRMMSRRELTRVMAEASRRLGSDTGWFGARLVEYRTAFTAEGDGLVSTGVDAFASDSPSRSIAADGNGAIAAAVNPLLANRLGRPATDGASLLTRLAVETNPAAALTFAGTASTGWHRARGGGTGAAQQVERLYLRGLWRNAALLVGRDHGYIGQGEAAGLTASLNARGIDQVRLSSDRPFVLPSLLRYAGPIQATAMLGDLGPKQNFPHARLLAYRMSARPHPRLEVGAGLTEQVGGAGSPPGSFAEKARDAVPIIDALIFHHTFLFSNKFVGFDARYSLPFARGAQVYVEGSFDDFDLRRARSAFTEDAAYVWGVSSSCLPRCGPVRASLEHHATGLRFFTHAIFTSGYTVDGQIIGDPLGPRAKGTYASLDIDEGAVPTSLTFAYEDRSGNRYGAASSTPDDADFHFVILERHPAERRWRLMTQARRGTPASAVAVRAGVGVERVENLAHVEGVWRTNWTAQLGVEYRVRKLK